ncbi:class I SAM-dependent methyltransferase [Sedimentibacter sp. zth1]|uniref:class I SAM-dependent methyltransferase n=1 Tax=Sedimentibacter sp. zth1 TaxID=2816908 RepID=UPI001A936439|nr:class I SAM-dependent methyltransferase [Sedimentibacter sp. zth1]QSX06681.1 class I SAM-dependent methyltransferase [Sedimentibacter sp. zth1]
MDIGKYTLNAKKYIKYRTEYPKELIDYLYKSVGLSKKSIIADIGSGTGKLSKHLLLSGSYVCCVEPNDDMRRVAEIDLSKFSNFMSINGTAENTTLQDSSVDFITVGTAFHWFDMEKFRKECCRILKPNGKVILVWISRPVNRKESFEINYNGLSGGKEEEPELISSFFKNKKYEYKIFEEKSVYDKDTFIGRALSTFDKLADAKYVDELSTLFDNHKVNETVTINLYTRCIIGEV